MKQKMDFKLFYLIRKIKEARFYHWYSYSSGFITKPEKFDLEWAKSIKDNYEKYL